MQVLKRSIRAIMMVGLSLVLFVPRAQASSFTFSSDCANSQSLSASDSTNPLGLSVSGLLSLDQVGSGHCLSTWTAETRIHLPAGTYVVGNTIDFDYDLTGGSASNDGGGDLVWDFSVELLNTASNIGTSSSIFVPGSGHVNLTFDESIFHSSHALAEGDYTMRQSGKVTLELTGGGSIHADLDFPVTSFVAPAAIASPVPEPGSLASLFGGLGLLALRLRKSRR